MFYLYALLPVLPLTLELYQYAAFCNAVHLTSAFVILFEKEERTRQFLLLSWKTLEVLVRFINPNILLW